MVNLGYQMTALEEFHRSATVLSNVRAHERAMLIEMTLPKPTQLPRSARFLAEEILWPFPPPDWSSAISATHIWAIPLDLNPAAVEEFHATLAPAERERAARFHFSRDRDRFVVGRGALRHILGRCLQTAPTKLRFTYGPHGKPSLEHGAEESGLQFNLAHSDGLALLAVTRAAQIGVDLERVRPLKDADGLVTRFFFPREITTFQSLPEDQKPAAFFNLWTRKEAWLKAIGEGIGYSLNLVEVSFLPGEPARLLALPEAPHANSSGGTSSIGTLSTASLNLPELPDAPQAATHWNLHDLTPAPGFAAALAIPRADTRLQCWRWPNICD